MSQATHALATGEQHIRRGSDRGKRLVGRAPVRWEAQEAASGWVALPLWTAIVFAALVSWRLFSWLPNQHAGVARWHRRGIDAITADSCPYAIDTESQALAKAQNTSIPGNVVTIYNLKAGRTGNHFIIVYRTLALGFCCKSKLVVLPPKDDVVAPGVFNQGAPGPRWFDFSNAPDVEGFDWRSCSTDITWDGPTAFYMRDLDTPGHRYEVPMLHECIGTVPRLVGCEAAYYFPTNIDVCPVPDETGKRQDEHKDSRMKRPNATAGSGLSEVTAETEEAGRLVIHMRSGDIFRNPVHHSYGQPPLQFYEFVLRDLPWERVDVVTYADRGQLNPVIPELQARIAKGDFADNVHFHTNRTLGEDMQAMMCADSLALANSTLRHLVAFHTSAVRVYVPKACNEEAQGIATAYPNKKVYGLSWPGDYSVYGNWDNSPGQLEEMMNYTGIAGFNQCVGHQL